jgi:hypothetical protein
MSERKPIKTLTVRYWRPPNVVSLDKLPDLAGPEAVVSRCTAIEEVLLEHGLPAPVSVVTAIDNACHSYASQAAGEALRHLLLSLPPLPSVVALRLVILGQEQSYREAAREAGISHTALLRALKLFRQPTGSQQGFQPPSPCRNEH